MRALLCMTLVSAVAAAARADDAEAAKTLTALKANVQRDKNLPGEPVVEVYAPNLKPDGANQISYCPA